MGNRQVIFMQLDLSSLRSIRSFADDFLLSESRLDLLINNAGVNHLGHFLLTVLLLDQLKASGPSRMVTVASRAYEVGTLDFKCLTTQRDFGSGGSDYELFLKYSSSKLCNILFTYELAKRLQGSAVTCYSLHPGFIKTEICRYTGFWWRLLFLFASDAESGAQTTLHCALEPGIEHLSGHYFSHCVAKARDEAAANKLWELSQSFCGLS